MKQVINRKLYDTESAEQLAQHAPRTDRGDFYYLIETLYRTDDGELFLHGQGGAATKYAKPINGGKTSGEEIRLMNEDDAVGWCEERAIDGEIVVEEFGHLIDA